MRAAVLIVPLLAVALPALGGEEAQPETTGETPEPPSEPPAEASAGEKTDVDA